MGIFSIDISVNIIYPHLKHVCVVLLQALVRESRSLIINFSNQNGKEAIRRKSSLQHNRCFS
jgi:hypothetical protein